MPRTLRAGDKGPDVQAMQEALHTVLRGRARNNKKGAYGSLTVRDVALFKTAWTKETDGSVFGANAWGHIEDYLGKRQKKLLEEAKAQEVKRQHEAAEPRTRGIIVAEALWALANNGRFVYRQYRPMPASLRVPEARDRVDCSTFVTLCYKAGGAPDPNGRGYDGLGYTGTMWGRGEAIASPGPTDLAFYGDMGNGIPSHVAIVTERGWVVSDGHTPISRYPLLYRRDYRGSRRYPAL
jgi:cell wall-associated NlpC family hydrolase